MPAGPPPATPRSGPRVTSSHQPAVDSLEAGRMTRSAGTPDFSTEPHGRSTRNTWNGSPQRELTTNTLSGKLGADHPARQGRLPLPPAPELAAHPHPGTARSRPRQPKPRSQAHDRNGRTGYLRTSSQVRAAPIGIWGGVSPALIADSGQMRPVGYALADDTAAHLYRCQELCGFDTHSSRSARRTRLASPPFSFIAASFSSARQQFSRGHAGGAMSAIRFPGTARFARIVTVAGVLAVLAGVALAAGSPAQPARAIGAAPASRFISVASLSRPARSFPAAAG